MQVRGPRLAGSSPSPCLEGGPAALAASLVPAGQTGGDILFCKKNFRTCRNGGTDPPLPGTFCRAITFWLQKRRKIIFFQESIDKTEKITYDVGTCSGNLRSNFNAEVVSMESGKKKVLVIGVIGADVHAVGNKILYHAFTEAGFDVVNLGVMVSQEEYIAAAIESAADAIVISSLYGQGELDCRGMREKCDEAGLKGIPLLVGGNIVIGKQKFEDVEKRFKEMGFDRAFPPNTPPETTIEALREILHMDGEAQ